LTIESSPGIIEATTAEGADMETIQEHEAMERFDDMLDEVYEPYNMGGMEYMPSQILKECDPIAYRVSLADYIDAETIDGNFTVEGYV